MPYRNEHIFTVFSPGFWLYDGSRFWLDETARQTLRLPPGELTASSFLQHFDTVAREQLLHILEKDDRGDVVLVNAVICRDGHCTDILMQGSIPLRDERGRAMRCAGYLIEVKNAFSIPRVYNSPEVGLWEWNAITGKCSFCEDYHRMLGYDWPGEGLPQDIDGWVELVHPDDRDAVAFQQQMSLNPAYGDKFECTVRIRHKRGHYVWTIGRGFVVQRNAHGQALALRGSNQNIEVVRERYAKSLEDAMRDTLTGCRNRSFFREEWPRLKRDGPWPLSLLYIDVCGLKMVNDALGHDRGDRLLLETVNVLSTVIQMPKYIIRMGGDEFLVLLPDCTPPLADECARNLAKGLMLQKEADVPVIFAIGAASLTRGESLDAAIRTAEREMQRAKTRSRAQDQARLLSAIERPLGRAVCHQDDRVFCSVGDN